MESSVKQEGDDESSQPQYGVSDCCAWGQDEWGGTDHSWTENGVKEEEEMEEVKVEEED